MTKYKEKDHDWSVGRGYGCISLNKEDGTLSGTVKTQNGFVEVYSQGCSGYVPSTTLEFIFNSRGYSRIINRHYSSRYLVTVAKKFAKEIVEKYKTSRISYATQVLLAIYDFQKEHNRGIRFNELIEKTGLNQAIVSKSFDYHMDRGIIKDEWAIVDGNHCKLIFITKHTMETLEERIQQVKEWLE